jgi:hypothetical protein
MPGGIARHQFLAKSGKRARQVVERQAGEEQGMEKKVAVLVESWVNET